MKISNIAAAVATTLTLLAAAPASAALITSLNEGTLLTMGVENYFGTGPKTLAPGITWTSTYGSSVYGYNDGYGFGSNGYWQAPLVMVGSNDGALSSVMKFAFDAPVAAFGGFFNYSLGATAIIAAYDGNNALLEQFTLDFATGGDMNAGQFYGFSYASNQIASFTMRGGYIGGANFRVAVEDEGQVPEPGSVTLIGLGLLGVAAARRAGRKSKQG